MPRRPVRVRGLNELTRALPRFGRDLEHDLAEVERSAASQAATIARARVPRRTGALAASVETDDHPAAATMGAGLDYAGWIEFGGTRGRPYVPEGRYLWPAARALEDQFRDGAEHQTKQTIRRYPWPRAPLR